MRKVDHLLLCTRFLADNEDYHLHRRQKDVDQASQTQNNNYMQIDPRQLVFCLLNINGLYSLQRSLHPLNCRLAFQQFPKLSAISGMFIPYVFYIAHGYIFVFFFGYTVSSVAVWK